MGGELDAVRAIHGLLDRVVVNSSAMTHISDNDTSIRLAPVAIETGGVPAVCVTCKDKHGIVGL